MSYFLVVASTGYAQDNRHQIEVSLPEWYDGSILLKDGTELKGLIRYNAKEGILGYEQGVDSRSFVPDNVLGFEYFDERSLRQRVYYSLPYSAPDGEVTKTLFFEVVKDLVQFALLSIVDPVNVNQKIFHSAPAYNRSTGLHEPGAYHGSSIRVTQSETLYILDGTGTVTAYAQISEKDIDGVVLNRTVTNNKILDEDLLKRVTDPVYGRIKAYAEANALKFSNKADLVKILEYYASLVH